MKKVYIIGAGGHTRSLINLLELNKYSIVSIYDDNFMENEKINGYRVSGRIADINKSSRVVISTGNNNKREILYKTFNKQLLRTNLIHPKASLEKRIDIGDCNQILASAYINSNASIGCNNLLNTGCILEHEVSIGNHCHVSVASILCGRVKVGNRCFIGAGAVVINDKRICDDVTIGANSVVIRDINEPGTYVGNPVRRIK